MVERKVNQTRFGGSDSPPEERGNCFQAAIATVLNIPLEEAFDCTPYEDTSWFPAFQRWLAPFRLGVVWIENNKVHGSYYTKVVGLHIAEVESMTLKPGDNHAIVIKDGDLLHDPNPNAHEIGKPVGIYLFVPLDAGEKTERAAEASPSDNKNSKESYP